MLKVNGIMFREEETELIERKFDVDFTKKQINYIKLITAIHRSVTSNKRRMRRSLGKGILRGKVVKGK